MANSAIIITPITRNSQPAARNSEHRPQPATRNPQPAHLALALLSPKEVPLLHDFEQLMAWQKARDLTSAIYRVTREGEFARDFALRDQIRSAAISGLGNIAEGFERGTRPAFHAFLRIAKGSVGEVRSHLYVALDLGYISQTTFDHLTVLAKEAGGLIGGLMRAIRNQNPATRTRNS